MRLTEIGESTPFLTQSFEGGIPNFWTATGLWHATAACARPSLPCDGSAAWAYYGVDASCSFRVITHEADSFELVNDQGKRLPLFVQVNSYTVSTPSVEIAGGSSGVVTKREGDYTVVLFKDGKEIRRTAVTLAPGGVQELRF